jgi:hypothetical protein
MLEEIDGCEPRLAKVAVYAKLILAMPLERRLGEVLALCPSR